MTVGERFERRCLIRVEEEDPLIVRSRVFIYVHTPAHTRRARQCLLGSPQHGQFERERANRGVGCLEATPPRCQFVDVDVEPSGGIQRARRTASRFESAGFAASDALAVGMQRSCLNAVGLCARRALPLARSHQWTAASRLSTMTAMTVVNPGPKSTLEAATVPVPECGPNDVLIKVHAAGVNRPDLLQVRGWPCGQRWECRRRVSVPTR